MPKDLATKIFIPALVRTAMFSLVLGHRATKLWHTDIMKYYAIINSDVADSQWMLGKDVYDMLVIFKGKLQNSVQHLIPFLLKIYFVERSLSNRAPGMPTCGHSHTCTVHPTLYPRWALWPIASGKKWRCAPLTLGCKILGDFHFAHLSFCVSFYSFSLGSFAPVNASCHGVSSPMGGPPGKEWKLPTERPRLVRSQGLQQPCGTASASPAPTGPRDEHSPGWRPSCKLASGPDPETTLPVGLCLDPWPSRNVS